MSYQQLCYCRCGAGAESFEKAASPACILGRSAMFYDSPSVRSAMFYDSPSVVLQRISGWFTIPVLYVQDIVC